MKSRLCAFLLLSALHFFCFQRAEAQFSLLFPTHTVEWGEDQLNSKAGTATFTQTSGFKSDGDTIIQGKTYTRMLFEYFRDYGGGNAAIGSWGYAYAYRVDSQQVWLWAPGQNRELLWYDFELAVGDTFVRYDLYPLLRNWSITSFDSIASVVQKVDTFYAMGHDRRRYWFDSTNTYDVILEGIGYMSSITSPGLPLDADLQAGIHCFSHNGEVLARWPYVYGSCTTLARPEPRPMAAEVKVGPVPARDHLTVNPDFQHEYSLNLFSTDGRLMYRQQALRGSSIVNLENLPSGIYVLRIRTQNSWTFKRFLHTD